MALSSREWVVVSKPWLGGCFECQPLAIGSRGMSGGGSEVEIIPGGSRDKPREGGREGGNMAASPRRGLMMMDVLILIGAAGVGFAGYREYLRTINVPIGWVVWA